LVARVRYSRVNVCALMSARGRSTLKLNPREPAHR
jgi:hypothetical protein